MIECLDPVLNTALDAAQLAFTDAHSVPAFRVYTLSRPCLSYGVAGSPPKAIQARAEAEGIPVIARQTGGLLHLHSRDEVLLSVSVPETHPLYQASLQESLRALNYPIAQAFAQLGYRSEVEAEAERRGRDPSRKLCFLYHHEDAVLVQGQKVVGAAQIRFDHGMLHNATVVLAPDSERMESVFAPLFRKGRRPPWQRAQGFAALLSKSERQALRNVLAGELRKQFLAHFPEVESKDLLPFLAPSPDQAE